MDPVRQPVKKKPPIPQPLNGNGHTEHEQPALASSGLPTFQDRPRRSFSIRDTFGIDLGPERNEKGEIVKDAQGKEVLRDRKVEGYIDATEHTPDLNPNYVFPRDATLAVLMGISGHDPILLVGHTGVGKTSLIEQIGARLNFSVIKISFDCAVNRNDIVGEWVVKGKEMQFQYGIVPVAFRMPGTIIILDEWDAQNAETAYVLQRPLQKEERKIFLLETLELINMHPDNVICACLVAGTLVTDHDGVPRCISELSDKQAPVLCIDWKDGNTLHTMTDFKVNPKNQPVIRVRTSTSEFTGTPNHPVFVLGPEGIVEIPLENLEPGMSIARLKQLPEPKCAADAKTLCTTKTYTRTNNSVILPEILTEPLAQLLGYCMADGSFTFSSSNFRLGFHDKDLQVATYYTDIARTLFGEATLHPVSGKNSYYGYVDSRNLGMWFITNFPELIGGKQNRIVPELIWKSNNKIIGSFLKGFFDGDGTCSGGRPACTGTNQRMIKEVGLLLQRLGIGFTRDTHNTKAGTTAVRLSVAGGIPRRNFNECVGFSSEVKRALLDKYLKESGKCGSGRSSIADTVPIPWTAFNSLLEHNKVMPSHLHQYINLRRQGSRVGRGCVNRWYEQIPFIKELMDPICKLDWDPVLEVELAGQADVFDVSVPVYHNFVADGLVMHNTANTNGQGDDTGLYGHGTRVQSYAQLNRFTVTVRLDYLPPEQEKEILSRIFEKEALDKDEIDSLVLATNKVRDGFTNGQISVPLSTRDLINWTDKYIKFGDAMKAATFCFLNRMSIEDAKVCEGLIQRSFEEN